MASTIDNCYDILKKAEKKLEKVQRNPKASQDERSYALQQRNTAQEHLATTIKAITDKPDLILYTVEEVKTFTLLLPTHHFADRGMLQRVEIGTTANDDRPQMWNMLESAGLKLEQPKLTFTLA